MTKVYGVYADCNSLADVQERNQEKRSMYKRMHALDEYKLLYRLYPFSLEDMVGTEWVNAHTFSLVEIDEVIDDRWGKLNACYDESEKDITVYREIAGEKVPCIEHWIRFDSLSPELQLEFLVARWKWLKGEAKDSLIGSQYESKAKTQWLNIKHFCHYNQLPMPKKPVEPGEQISLFDVDLI